MAVLKNLILRPCNHKETTGYGHMVKKIKTSLEKYIPISLEESGNLDLTIWPIADSNRIRPNKSIYLTMWECSKLPDSVVNYINQCRMVIVPSKYCKNVFIENKVNKPIAVVPLGVDAVTYSNSINDICTFGIAGTLFNRKNVHFVIKSFKKAFSDKNAILKIKTTKSSMLSHLNINSPKINLNDNIMSEQEMCKWYSSLDALISCAHSEGFGLHQLEAMSCGIPLISPKFGGITEFFDELVGYCVDYKITDAKTDGDRIYDGHWCSAIESSLIEKMLIVYNNREHAKKLGVAARERASHFTWDRTALNLIKKINNYVNVFINY